MPEPETVCCVAGEVVDDWPTQRVAARDAVVRTLASYAPNLPGAILAEDVLRPPDLKERLALTGGDIFHGALVPEQSFGERFDYRTPVEGLYLCGSGARPGGGVMGAAGPPQRRRRRAGRLVNAAVVRRLAYDSSRSLKTCRLIRSVSMRGFEPSTRDE